MQTITRNTLKLAVVLLMVIAMLGFGHAPSVAYAACTPTVTFDLYAKTGTAVLYGSTSVSIWGFSSTSGGTAGMPGPVLDVAVGDCVGVNLYNVDIPTATSLLFQGQEIVPDTTGVGSGGSVSYSFVASNPGTFLYEAGLTSNGLRQVGMGMYGALIVRPATVGQAYDSAASAFDTEAVVVLSEYDTALGSNPTGFDMRNYKPKYYLINGKAYPGTAPILATVGDNLLLRYVNAGVQSHPMSLLGLTQTVIAQDGDPYLYPHKMVSETIAPGQTLDTIAPIPATTVVGSQFVLYDSNLMLRNNTGNGAYAGFGGMLTFITTGTPALPGPDTVGPASSNVSLPPNALNGTMNAALTASVSDVDSGLSNVTAAEYFIDTTGANGTGSAMSGTFGTVGPINVSATISGATIGGLSTGNHTVYVHGQDSIGNWGPFSLGTLKVDNTPPNTTSPALSPNPANGTVNVALSATANDMATGNSNIAAAEYWIDGGSPVAMTVLASSPNSGLSATISAATVNALSQGAHTVHIHSTDVLNAAWGPEATITLTVDKTGPTTSSVSAAPNPNNGALGLNTSVQAVRVSATFNDTASGNANIAAGEGFIDTVGANGMGFAFIASDGLFNTPNENGYADVPLAVINTLSAGNHTIYVHGKDAAGNWGATSTTTLVIDKTPPSIVSVNRVDPTPTTATSVQFLVTFSESVTGVTSGNFSLVQGGGLTGASITSITGTGPTRTVTVATGSGGGTLGLNLTSATGIKDIAGNALPATGLPFVGQTYTLLTPPLYFSTAGNTNPPGVGGTADNADIYFWNGSAFSRSIDATAAPYTLPGGANVDGFDRVSATQFYLSFNGAVTVPGIAGTVQDEDIVFFNGTTWSLYFDGSALGLPSGNFDLDAISIVGAGGAGNVYFSTDNNNVPTGAGGTGDDADIYRWNGGSSYTRIIDASVLGLSSNNVDGLAYVDATHFYLSYAPDNTTVTGLGTVQDEDVVYYNAGIWSVYFDGTSKGLTGGNLDVDAFDLP